MHDSSTAIIIRVDRCRSRGCGSTPGSFRDRSCHHQWSRIFWKFREVYLGTYFISRVFLVCCDLSYSYCSDGDYGDIDYGDFDHGDGAESYFCHQVNWAQHSGFAGAGYLKQKKERSK